MRKVNKQGIGRTDNRSKFEIKLEKEYYQLLENSKKYRLNNRSQTILFSSRQTITRILLLKSNVYGTTESRRLMPKRLGSDILAT